MLPRFDGPYEIVKEIGKDTYQLSLPPGSTAHNAFHADLLRLYVPNDDELFPLREHERPPAVPGTDEEYEVEAILESRRHRRQLQYLVKWLGYPDSDNQWVAAKDISAPDAVKAFYSDHPSAVRLIEAELEVGKDSDGDDGTDV